MRFDLLSLRLFVTVCEHESISRAADLENIAASAVSKRISELEQIVRTPLFYRGSRGLEMTPVAYDVLRHARVVLRDLAQLESEMLDHAPGERGDVRVCASHSPIVQHLPGDLATFLALQPAIRITIDERSSRDVVRHVSENAADIGIFSGATSAPGLHIVPYRTDRLVMIMPVDHHLADAERLSFAEVAEHDIIGPQSGSCLDVLLMQAAADLAHPLQLRIRVNGFEPASRMAEAGLGIALVPEHHARRYADAGHLVSVPLDEAWAIRTWMICSREPRTLPQPVKLLLDHLRPPNPDGSVEDAPPTSGAETMAPSWPDTDGVIDSGTASLSRGRLV